MQFYSNNPSKKLSKSTDQSAGYDIIYPGKQITIKPNQTVAIDSELKVEIPLGYCGLVKGRSGMGFKHHVVPLNVGVIDSDYRGNIKILMHNYSTNPYTIHTGDRIAQLIITLAFAKKAIYLRSLEDTDRGSDGFGSSGK